MLRVPHFLVDHMHEARACGVGNSIKRQQEDEMVLSNWSVLKA